MNTGKTECILEIQVCWKVTPCRLTNGYRPKGSRCVKNVGKYLTIDMASSMKT
jgi:hypothetical protein